MLVKVFKTPELTGNNRSLHFLRAYHLVDLLQATTAEDIEYVLNNAPEFVASEKKEGIYIYQESLEPKEVPVEEEKAAASFLESLAEQLAGSGAEARPEISQEQVLAEEPEQPGAEEVEEAARAPEAVIQLLNSLKSKLLSNRLKKARKRERRKTSQKKERAS